TSAAAGLNAFICRQRDIANVTAHRVQVALPHDGAGGGSLANYLMPRQMELLLTLTCINFKTSSSKHHKDQVRTHAVVLNIIKHLAYNVALPSLR
ncbi:hypothetical protein, partial [Mesorhizobium sp.]|uniref:hypothetical protein n=1 Tax=Mesorhizobium sp. TaxID=1871066 RepID=UPI0025E013E5